MPSSSAFSIDDLVRETLEQNNNNTSKTSAPPLPNFPPPPLPSKSPTGASPHPPMVPLFDAPRPESPVPESKQPLVRLGKTDAPPVPRPQTPILERRGAPPMVPLVEPERPESPVPMSKQPLVRLQKGGDAPLSPPVGAAPPLPPSKAPTGAPPMVSLVDEQRPESPVPTSKQHVMRVERGTNLPTTPVQKQKFVTVSDSHFEFEWMVKSCIL